MKDSKTLMAEQSTDDDMSYMGIELNPFVFFPRLPLPKGVKRGNNKAYYDAGHKAFIDFVESTAKKTNRSQHAH